MATTPEEDTPPIITDQCLDLESGFESQDGHCEDLQPTEADPCIPLTSLNDEIPPKCCEGSAPDPLPNATTPKKKLTLTKQNGRVQWPGSELEGRLRKKFGLNHDGYQAGLCLLGLVLLLVTIVIILSVLWPGTPHSRQFPVCTNAACLRASSVILPEIDQSVSPCTDLYQYACGSWASSHPKPPPTRPRWDASTERRLQQAETIRNAIATLPHPRRTQSITWKTKLFYDSCMALDNIETDSKRPLKGIINELGGWSVLREFSHLSWDPSQTLVRIQAEYGVTPFFMVSVVPDPNNSSRSVLELSPNPLGLPDLSYYQHKESKIATSYRNYMKDVVQLLGATSTDARLFADDMFYFERRIAERLPPSFELEDSRYHQLINVSYLKTIAPSEKEKDMPAAPLQYTMIEDLSSIIQTYETKRWQEKTVPELYQVPVQEILSALLPLANVGDQTQILVRSTKYMTAVSGILSATDRSALNNYFIWLLAKMYLPYMSQDLLDIHFVYMRDTTGVSEPPERWEVCVDALMKFQGVGLTARLEKLVPEDVRARKKQVVENMFSLLRDAVKESITKAAWIDVELYQHITKKLDKLGLHVGFSDNHLDDLFLEEYYAKLFVQKNDFFRNIRYGVSYLQEAMQRRYITPRTEYFWLEDLAGTKVTYVPAANSIIIPQAQLQEPLFHTDYPPGLIYGGVGVNLARAIVTAIMPPLGLHTANGTQLPANSFVANLSRSSLDPQIACLDGNSSSQGLNSFYTLSAIRQASKALGKAVKTLPHIHQPGLEELEDSSLMILKFAQEQCTVQTSLYEAVDLATDAPLRGQQLLSVVTTHLKTAAEAFSCSLPTNRCTHLL